MKWKIQQIHTQTADMDIQTNIQRCLQCSHTDIVNEKRASIALFVCASVFIRPIYRYHIGSTTTFCKRDKKEEEEEENDTNERMDEGMSVHVLV